VRFHSPWFDRQGDKKMTWIRMITEDEADGELKATYERLTDPWGGVDNILKIHSLNLPSLLGHYDLYRILMYGRSGLSRVQREMIAVVVSATNQCHY
jgi:alkylhydroperoxidase family enzyme